MIYKDKAISAFILIAILISVPTWFSGIYPSDDLAWFVSGLSRVIRMSLLPLMAWYLVENKTLKIVFILYFILTLSNIATEMGNYLGWLEPDIVMYKIILAGSLAIYLMYKLWKHEGAFKE